MHLEQLATQAARQTLNPLDDVLEELGVTADQYPEQVWDGGIVDGVRYGVPLDVHCLASYANRSMLATRRPVEAAGHRRRAAPGARRR